MRQIKADMVPKFTADISENEKQLAKDVKKQFKDLLKNLDASIKIIYAFKDALVQEHPSKEDLQNKYHGRILRYKRKISSAFNELLKSLKDVITLLHDILDPEMINLRALIMSEFDELSDIVEETLTLLGSPNEEEFTKKIERLCTQLDLRQKSIKEIIEHQMLGHLENDILGKMKISELKTRIIKRTRLLRIAHVEAGNV